jgi:hypothetical protein
MPGEKLVCPVGDVSGGKTRRLYKLPQATGGRPTMKGLEVREKILAIICLTAIAIFAMMRLTDPENIVVNIIVARRTDVPPPAIGRT